jgi:cytochrome P450
MTDDPRHQRVRRLVSKGLTPRVIGRLEVELRRRSRALLERASGLGECDFVETVAGELPMQAVCMLLGIPEGDRHRLFTWIEHSFDFRDRDYMEPTDEVVAAMAELHAYGTQLIEEKRARPRDDMLSVVVHAELPDEHPSRLTDEELQLFFSLLFAAGADTTRHATAGGVLALAECPAQYDALRHDRSLLATATEEIVRWSSPAAYNRRTATSDIELGGLPVRPGDKVVFWEASANRDETVFPDIKSFDVRRDPNPHVGFGHGVHHCLGASLARLELRVVLDEVLDRFDAVEPAGTPEWTRSNKHTGIRRLPVRLTSGAAS